MAELLQSCIRQEQQAGYKRTSFAVHEDTCTDSASSNESSDSCSVAQEDIQSESLGKDHSSQPRVESECEMEKSIQEDRSKPTSRSKYVKKPIKGKIRGKIQKLPRTITVHLHNGKSIQLTFHFKAGEEKPVLRVQQVKDALGKALNIEQLAMNIFAIYIGTSENPMQLLRNTSPLPEKYSHFTMAILDFNWDSKNKISEFALELVVCEIRNRIKQNKVLPQLSRLEIDGFKNPMAVKSSDISTFLKTHCLNVSNEAYAQPFPSLLFANPSTKIDIQLALDMRGIHFFDVLGTALIATFPWSAIPQVKSQKRPTCLFMFDIVVHENAQYLRSIVVQTPHCEYLASIADAILTLHCDMPKVNADDSTFQGNFSTIMPKYNPYSLVEMDKTVSFKECIANGASHDMKKIYTLAQCISNSAYEAPQYVFQPNLQDIPVDLVGIRYNIYYRTFQVIYYSQNTYKKERSDSRQKVDPSMIFLIIPVNKDRSISAKEVKMAIIRTLHLKNENSDLFGLFLHQSLKNTTLYLFSDEDHIPDGYYEFIFRSLIFNWSENVDPHQWSSIKEDENTSKLLFWEIMCGHGDMINQVDEILELLINSCMLGEFVREMGAIADLHAVTCVLKKAPECIASSVSVNQKVILSMDSGWLHLWECDTGQRISSWNWNAVSTIRRETMLNEQVKFEIFVPNKFDKHNHYRYQTLAVETNCASYVMTVVGYILDGYSSHSTLVNKYQHLKKTRKKLLKSDDDDMEVKDVDEESGGKITGALTTFIEDGDDTGIKRCIPCAHLSSTRRQKSSEMEDICEHIKATNIAESSTESVCEAKNDRPIMVRVNEESLCTKIEYLITESVPREFLIKYNGTNGFKFLKDVRVLPESKLIDVIGYYWNRNFTGSMGRRHKHKVLANPREIVSFRSILPDDGLFPACHLELPQCCFSISVPHLTRSLSLLAKISHSDGRKYFSCFSTKPYRYRL